MIKEILKGVWMFCSYLFVPQWGRHPKDGGTTDLRNHGLTEAHSAGVTEMRTYGNKDL